MHFKVNPKRCTAALALTMIVGLTLASCSSADTAARKRTVEEIFTEGMDAYNDSDFTEAASKFDVIKLQFPASQYADDAQYRIAEINYKRGEFVMAAYNYSVVRRSFPASEWAKPAAFKVGECYEKLMLPPDRDQDYTRKAIQAYTEFQQLYPTDSLALQAVTKIHELRNNLAERYLLIAEHYVKTNSKRAAIVYFDSLIDEFPDSDWYEDALVGKISMQYMLTMISECRATIAQYKKTVKDPKRLNEVTEMERNLP